MNKIIRFKDGTVQDFNLNRNGFIQAVSYKESSADLKLSPNHKINIIASAKKSAGGTVDFSKWVNLLYLKQDITWGI